MKNGPDQSCPGRYRDVSSVTLIRYSLNPQRVVLLCIEYTIRRLDVPHGSSNKLSQFVTAPRLQRTDGTAH